MTVYGVVGAGKSTFIARLLHETMAFNMGFLLIDYEGEYTALSEELQAKVYTALGGGSDGQPLRVPLLEPPPGISAEAHSEWAYNVLALTIIEAGWSLTPQMEAILRESVEQAVRDRASVRELQEYIEAESRRVPAGQQTAAALRARLARVTRGPLSHVFSGEDTLGNPLRGRKIVNIHPVAVQSGTDARLVALTILYRARQTLLQRPVRNRSADFLIVIEEADDLLREGYPSSNLVTELIIHGRKRGVGTIIVGHSPTTGAKTPQALTGSKAVFRQATYRDAQEAADLIGDRDAVEQILTLPTGTMILKPATANTHYTVTVSPLTVRDDLSALLESVARYPYLTTRERRNLLGWDGRRYNKVVEEAIRRGLVEVRYAYKGVGRPVKLLQLRSMTPSAPHHYGVHHADRIISEELGLQTTRNPFSGPDIEFQYRGLRIALEVETGANIDMGKITSRLKTHDHLIILCITSKCVSQTKKILSTLTEKHRVTVTTLNGLKTKIINIPKKH